jgi:hypothetical protein
MKPFVETRMFTQSEQIACIQPNETDDGVVLLTQEAFKPDNIVDSEARLYLTIEEAVELSNLLLATIARIKK